MIEESAVLDIAVPIGTFLLGFFASRFSMSKKERRDYEQGQYQNALQLAENQRQAYDEFTRALRNYSTHEDPGFEDFVEIATTGDKYFYQLKLVAEATLSGKVDATTRDETLIPMLLEATEKSLPAYYEALTNIAEKKGYPYQGSLKRENYQTIYSAVEKFA